MALGLEQRDTAILARAIDTDQGNLRKQLGISLSPSDDKRRSELVDNAREGTLTSVEMVKLEQYRRAGRILEMMKAKARVSLKK